MSLGCSLSVFQGFDVPSSSHLGSHQVPQPLQGNPGWAWVTLRPRNTLGDFETPGTLWMTLKPRLRLGQRFQGHGDFSHRFGAFSSLPTSPSPGFSAFPCSWLGVGSPNLKEGFGASRGPAQVLPSQSPHSKPSPSPVSPSLLLPGGFGSPWGSVPILGSGPASGRGSGCSSQVRNNKSLSTLSQLGSRAGRAWLSSFLQWGLPQLLTVMGIFQPGSLKITLRNNPACRCGSL